MAASDLIMAIMLLSAPVGTTEQAPRAERWPLVQAAIHKVAIDWEILDPRETRYVLVKPEDFQEDVDFLRKRRLDLEDAPNVNESDRLPSRQLVNDCIRFNRAYRKNLETRLLWESDRANVIEEAIRETEKLYKVWDSIRDAKCEFHYITVRRLALKKLKDVLGPELYSTGDMPPYVPEWRFAER